MAQNLWQSQEEDLVRRVTLLENFIRRSADLPAFDIDWDTRKKREQRAADQLAAQRVHEIQFRELYDGPFYPEGQVEEKQPGFYVHPGSETFKHTVEHNMVKHLKNEKFKDENQVTMFMAGDHDRLLDNFALLDDPDEEEEKEREEQEKEWYRRQGIDEEEYKMRKEYREKMEFRSQGFGRGYDGRSVYYNVPAQWSSMGYGGRTCDLYGREGYGSDLTRYIPWWAPC